MFPSANETELWKSLNLAQRSMYRTIELSLHAEGLPPLRWYDVLWVVERSGKKGIRPFEIEKALLFEQSNLSRLLARLTKENLITETVFAQDRRGKVHHITEKGLSMRQQMWEIYGPLIHEQLGELSNRFNLTEVTSALEMLATSLTLMPVEDRPKEQN